MAKELQKNILHYKSSRQLKTALSLLTDRIAEKPYPVIETQDLVTAVLEVPDNGIGYALGSHAISKKRIADEMATAKRVRKRRDPETDLEDVSAWNKKERIGEKIKEQPIELLKELPSTAYLEECPDYPLSNLAKEIFEFAEEMRQQNEPDGVIDSYWLLVGISQQPLTNAYQLIRKLMLQYGRWYDYPDKLDSKFQIRGPYYHDFYDGKAAKEKARQASRASQFENKLKNPDYSLLEDLATDLTLKAKNGELMAVVGREEEIQQMEITLTRRDKNNVVLLGDGGVGKSALVDGLAIKIARGEIASLKNKRILQFSLNDLYATMEGHRSAGILRFIEEMKREKDVILFVDEIHMLGANKSLTDAFKPIMARGDFRIIGATTPMEWGKYIESDNALVRRFEKIQVDEPDLTSCIGIVQTLAPAYENYHQVNFTAHALELAVRLAKTYLKEEKLPDSAFTIIDNAAAMVRISSQEPLVLLDGYQQELDDLNAALEEAKLVDYNEEEVESLRQKKEQLLSSFQQGRNNLQPHSYELQVTEEDIKSAVEQKIKGEVRAKDLVIGQEAEKKERERLANLKQTLTEKVIGQEEATTTVAEAVLRSKMGFRNPNRPVGVFLFLGTSGVGKTETAKVLSEEVTGSVEDLIRIDMSEYQQEHEVSKLIGAPPGYAGYGQGGVLTNAVKNNPKTVILFDEIEKAHPKVYDLLLQVFDEGHLTDSMGIKVDFKETIIILTSNLGISALKKDKQVGFNRSGQSELDALSIREKTMAAVQEFFRPELLNRIDEIVSFKPFSEESVLKITRLLVDKEKEVFRNQGYELTFSEEAIRLLAKRTYDPENGARPIRRGLTKLVETPLSELMLKQAVTKGARILVAVDEDELTFEVTATEQAREDKENIGDEPDAK